MRRPTGIARCVQRVLVVAVVALVLASPLWAHLHPRDPALAYAVRFSLKRNDLGSGWRSMQRPSTTLRETGCPSEPNVGSAITGFSDSARFRSIDYKRFAMSQTRAFTSAPTARRWYSWSGGGKLARCWQARAAKNFASNGYKVSDLQRRPESMPLWACYQDCSPSVLRAWRISQRLTRPGDRTTWYADVVVVRIEYIVIEFLFQSYATPFPAPGSYVSSVLQH